VPLVVVVANLWLFRQRLLGAARTWLNRRWHLHLRETPLLAIAVVRGADGGGIDRVDVVLRNLVFDDPSTPDRDEDDDEEDDGDRSDGAEPLADVAELRVGLAVRCVGRSRRRRLEVSCEVIGLVLTYVAYDARFQDTNLSRLLAQIRGPDDDDDEKEEEEEAPEEKDGVRPPTAPAGAPAPRRWVFRRLNLRNVELRVKAVGAYAIRRLGTVRLDDEAVDVKRLGSSARVLVAVNALFLRSLANLGFDAVEGAFKGASSVATGIAFAPLDAVDSVAEHLGGSRVVAGVTSGVRGVVGGVVGAGASVVGGVGAGGRAIVRGVTSGSAAGAAQGFADAGGAIAGGVVGAGTAVVGGVVDGGTAAAQGVAAGARSTARSLR